jgi:hypothetical protein
MCQASCWHSCNLSCERERTEIEKLYNEKANLEALVTGFKSNNEEYLKIKQAAEEKVKDVLTDGKLLLKFTILSVIESLRTNPELYNFVLYNIPNSNATSYSSKYPSLMLSGRQQQQQQSFNDSYTALILEEAEKLYNKLTTELTNSTIAEAADTRESSLPSLGNNTTNHKLAYKIDNTYQTEESRYNNQNRNL